MSDRLKGKVAVITEKRPSDLSPKARSSLLQPAASRSWTKPRSGGTSSPV